MRNLILRLSTVILLSVYLAGCTSASETQLSSQILDQNKDRLLAFLEGQTGKNAKPSGEIVFFDFDHTLADTRTMIPVETDEGRQYRDPKCFYVDSDEKPHYDALSEGELQKTMEIQEMLDLAKEKKKQGALVFIITARGEDHTWTSIPAWLKRRGLIIDGMVAVNSEKTRSAVLESLQLPEGAERLPRSFKKALLISGWIQLLEKRGPVDRISYYEDTDHHLRGAMQLLPAVHPEKEIRIFDVIRQVSYPASALDDNEDEEMEEEREDVSAQDSGREDMEALDPDEGENLENASILYTLELIAERKKGSDAPAGRMEFRFQESAEDYDSQDCDYE